MEDHSKMNYMKPAFLAFGTALLFAAFTQSCGASKAGISTQLAIATITPVIPSKDIEKPSIALKKYMRVDQGYVPQDSTVVISKLSVHIDTNKAIEKQVILDPYNISLNNQRKIIDLLINKDNEVKHLRGQIDKLSAKTKVTTKQKNDAISMETVWGMGQYILGGLGVIIMIMIIQILIFLRKHKTRISHIQTV